MNDTLTQEELNDFGVTMMLQTLEIITATGFIVGVFVSIAVIFAGWKHIKKAIGMV